MTPPSGSCWCDPTRGQSCRECDGTAAEERDFTGWPVDEPIPYELTGAQP